MEGLHLIADLRECACPPQILLDASSLEHLCVNTCRGHGLTVVGTFFHQFKSAQGALAGVTGTVVLAESHLALHTWPEIGGVTLDVYVCNFSGDNSAAARAVLRELCLAFQPRRCHEQAICRGSLHQAVTHLDG